MNGMKLSRKQGHLLVPVVLLAAALAWVPGESEAQGATVIQSPPPGAPLTGLSQNELNRFNAGRNEFTRNFRVEEGLGPVFNGVSCVQCHRAAAPGGASADLGVSVVTRFGGTVNGQYSDLENLGGALIQARSLREILGPNYPVPREVVPPQAQFVSRRITTPVFGLGLIEGIPASEILQREDVNDTDGDGISGKANWITNPENGQLEVGRFGWKCQVTSIHVFSGDAFLNEMGITTPSFTMEVRPQGNAIPPGADTVADPEDGNGARVNRVTDFQRFLGPPSALVKQSVAARNLFFSTGCASCHTPSMTTGPNAVAALSNRGVSLYSDLLLHDMGPNLGDGVRQGLASGSEWRTAPLWGLRFRPFLLHDGRATSVDQAIRLHGGEAAASAARYGALSQADRNSLLTFLQGL